MYKVLSQFPVYHEIRLSKLKDKLDLKDKIQEEINRNSFSAFVIDKRYRYFEQNNPDIKHMYFNFYPYVSKSFTIFNSFMNIKYNEQSKYKMKINEETNKKIDLSIHQLDELIKNYIDEGDIFYIYNNNDLNRISSIIKEEDEYIQTIIQNNKRTLFFQFPNFGNGMLIPFQKTVKEV